MAKKEIVNYINKDKKVLFLSKSYVYELSTYECSERYMAIYDTKIKKTDKFAKMNIVRKIINNKKTYIQYIDLIGAPIEFLTDYNYKKQNE